MQKLIEKIEAAQAAYVQAVETKPYAEAQRLGVEVKAIRQELATKIAEGAAACEGCGRMPHGILQPNGFEICCLACGDTRPRAHRPRGLFREQAVAAWNAEHAK
jgi:hypothetical protein